MEKRAHARSRSAELIKLVDLEPKKDRITNVHDISRSGLSFYLDKKVKPTRKLTLVIHIPRSDELVQVDVQIVRSERQKGRPVYKIGARFDGLNDADWDRIQPEQDKK